MEGGWWGTSLYHYFICTKPIRQSTDNNVVRFSSYVVHFSGPLPAILDLAGGAALPGRGEIFYFAQNSGSQMQQKAVKMVLIYVINMWFTNSYFLDYVFINASWHEVPPCDKIFFLWQDISSKAKKFLPVTGHFYIWQEISSCDKIFLPVTRNF